MAQLADLNAVQIADIDFNSQASFGREDDLDEFNKYWLSVYPDAGGYTAYQPFNSAYLDSYDGQNHVIKNLDINKVADGSTNAGIFGDLSTCASVKNVIITDSTVNAPGASAAGMFAAKFSGTTTLTVEKCYIGNVSVDASSAASVGGFAGEIAPVATVSDCAALKVNAGNTVAATNAGAFAGRITGVFTGSKLYVLGGKVSGSSNAGGLIGYSNAALANLALSGCKVSGAEVTATTGNAGAIAGYIQNQTANITINSDTVVAGSIVKSNTGNAGGFVGSTDSNLNITDSTYFMPGSSEGSQTAGSISSAFAKAVGHTASSDVVALTYENLRSLSDFKYINELKTSNISGMQWISGGSNAGGLIGTSTKDVTITNTIASGVLAATNGNAGGFIGNTSGRLSVTGSYSDFYISGKRAGGFAAGCAASSTFSSCYTAGFLVGNADIAAGFAPVDVGAITNSYTVFNFDNVTDTALFTGTAEEDEDHKLNENGTVSNYPNVESHSYYPVAKSNSGKAYYVYSETDFEENDNTVCVRASELAENKNEDGETLLTGSLVKSQGRNNTTPYTLSPFFGSILKDYPFPTLKVTKTVDGAASETVLKHYNDWLIIDGDSKYDIEVWYMLYNDTMSGLKRDVSFLRNAKAVPVKKDSTHTEYQINVGSRDIFSGYKFVGYFDPDTASKPLLSSASFDRTKKFDYLTSNDNELSESVKRSIKNGDRVVQTSISSENTYGYLCAEHSNILEESTTNSYAATRRIYAVYRYNAPYTVSLSYREYKLPASGATQESNTLEEIYKTKASKLTSDDVFEVIYTSPVDVYKFIYADQSAVKAKVAASHSKLASDEELTEDFIAEKVLADRFPNANTYKEKLVVLDDIRSGKKVTLDDGTTIAANNINQITRKVQNFKDAGFDLLDFDKLLRDKLINQSYYNNVTKKPVYTIVRIGPAKDSAGNNVPFNDRGCVKIEKDGNDNITLSTHKSFEYVILYNTNKGNQILNLVFKNTDTNAGADVVDKYNDLSNTLHGKAFNSDSSTQYTVRVGSDGFTDVANSSLSNLMKPENYPSFAGFTLANSERTESGDKETVTLTYERKTYALSFKMNSPAVNPPEKYNDGTTNRTSRDPITNIYYGQPCQDYLWGVSSETSKPTITSENGNTYTNYLKASTNNIYLYYSYSDYYWDDYYYKANGYSGLESYILSPTIPSTGRVYLEYKYRNSWYHGWFTWNKTPTDISYAFNREGYILTGFNVYHQNEAGEYILQDDSINSIEEMLLMPECNMMVEPLFTVNPKYLRVEIYYQSPYDNIAPESESEKQYELYRGTRLKVNNGVANQKYNEQGQLVTLNNPIRISELLTKDTSGTDLINYLEPYYKRGDFYKSPTHNMNGTEDGTGDNFNPYVPNAANTKRFGAHHFAGNDTMVVALYYDLTTVEYKFHFITQGGSNSYSVPRYSSYKIRSQWDDFITNSDLYNYAGTAEDHLAMKGVLQNTSSSDYVTIGKHAQVKVERNRTDNAVGNTSITYGGLYGSYYQTGTVNNGTTIKYGVTVYYKALYGAPAVFSSDNTSLIPYWYCYMGGTTSPQALQRYIIGGSGSTPTFYNEYSMKYFGDITSATAKRQKDLYPYYPGRSSGTYYFYTEVSPDELPNPTWTNYRTSPSQNANISMFNRNKANLEVFGKEGNVIFWVNNDWRVFIDGYSTYGYSQTSTSNVTTNISKQGVGGTWTDIHIYLERNEYKLNFVDAELKASASNFATSYLYKQVVPKLPSWEQIEGTAGDNYIFDGWYITSVYSDSTKIADRDGNILDSYKALSSTLVDKNNNLLMNHEDLQIFANWVPEYSDITFNPFYPDKMNYGVDSRLTIATNPVHYGDTIPDLPEVLAPEGYGENYSIEREGSDLYYVIRTESDEIIGKYKFLGWYKYFGADTPSSMDDLKIQFEQNETPVTGNATLYAKWETIIEKSTYTITCLDYSDGNKEILSVERYAPAGTQMMVNPPKYNDVGTGVAANDVMVHGSYSNLLSYESLTEPIESTIENGMKFTFLYKKAPEWTYIVNTCVTVDNTDIVIGSDTETTSYAIKQIEAPDITGYQIYQYQIEGDDPVDKDSTSDPIQVDRPDDITDSLVITIRYLIKDDAVTAKTTADYYKYDPIDWAEYAEGMLDWEDENYAPAIQYTLTSPALNVTEIIGDESSATAAAKAISALDPGPDYTVAMKLVAVSRTDPATYLDIMDIGETTVTIITSSYSVKFTDGINTGYVYYANEGSNSGYWYWDAELGNRIGADGASVVAAEALSELTGDVLTNAQAVQGIIGTADSETGKYKRFAVVVSDKAYIIVDDLGNLSNGSVLTSDTTAYMEGVSQTSYEIDLYNAQGQKIGTITVTVPVPDGP
ncbi:MAG: hypothetical protein K6C96_09245 [Butyrivibrio sp.]|nr:hypothetical protein [Butyrivibrio sp.]